MYTSSIFCLELGTMNHKQMLTYVLRKEKTPVFHVLQPCKQAFLQ